VEGADYTIWADNYLKSFATTFEQGDFNGDHVVDGADYTVWADNYNPAPLALSAATPEPTTASLMLVGSACGLLFAACRMGRAGSRDRWSFRRLHPRHRSGSASGESLRREPVEEFVRR
jgi:hypothetical protein